MIPGNINTALISGAEGGYAISRSLRFNSSDSAYLSRTPASAGNRKTWTWAGWVKRSDVASVQGVFSSSTGAIEFYGTYINVTETSGFSVNTSAVFRDPSAWYHFVFTLDTTQATASDRLKIFQNGVRLTDFFSTTWPNQNTDYGINSTTLHTIGESRALGRYFSGYLADIHFIDGQALDPTSFGEFDTNGIWQPKAFAGSYGSQGWHLDFADNSSNTATTLGKDTSPNGNNWTPNNLSVQGGASSVTMPATNAPPSVEYLVIGGGGGGGATHGGGGGAGGYRSSVSGESSGGGASAESALSVTAGASYSVTVGAGGNGGSATDGIYVGSAGTNSVFGSITSNGGAGAGGGATGQNATSGGGSGGGAGNRGGASNGTANQGFNGGTGTTSLSGEPAGGGGGAGSNGSNGTSGQAGNGGSGVSSSITGTPISRAGGGGGAISGGGNLPGSATSGGGNGGNPTATAGTANTGGGGGGGGSGTAGQPGGSGVVIIRYANTYSDLSVGGGLSYTYANTGGYKIYTFTSSLTPAQSAGNDSLVDVPTNGSEVDTGAGGEVRGNYAVLNALENTSRGTLSNGNLDYTSTGTGTGLEQRTATIRDFSSGKWYFECHVSNLSGSGDPYIGWFNKNFTVGVTNPDGSPDMWALAMQNNSTSNIRNGGTNTQVFSGASPCLFMIAIDIDAGKIWFGKDGTWAQSGNPATGTNAQFTNLANGPYSPLLRGTGSNGGTSTLVANFGQRPFAYTAPSGFKALNTANLPAPVITKPSTVMDVVTRTFTGATATVSSLAFSPDLLWFKRRDDAASHSLFDSVRGVDKRLLSNGTNGEITVTDALTSFNSNGFTLGADTGSISVNGPSSGTGVVWCWDAGSSTVTNTQGSITSQVRANVSAGFSVVTYTGTGSNATVGHGLNVAPSMVILKSRSFSQVWVVGHSSIGFGNYLLLNATDASAAGANVFNSTAPTSTVFSLGTGGGGNQSAATYVSYCFAPVAGYSSFGSYTGNGSTDGPFVFCNFRPKWLLLKSSTEGVSWIIYDTARNTYNLVNSTLSPNLSSAESAPGVSGGIDILSNGFKLRSSDQWLNFSAATYIYAAFAESPFQYARAR
jgi:hypothetical protein